MLACYGGHIEAGSALLAAGAQLAARNAWDCDAGHFAGMGAVLSKRLPESTCSADS